MRTLIMITKTLAYNNEKTQLAKQISIRRTLLKLLQISLNSVNNMLVKISVMKLLKSPEKTTSVNDY